MRIIIVSPSLNTAENVSGISAVCRFIISNNPRIDYIHFQQGKKDNERTGLFRFVSILTNYKRWIALLKANRDCIIHFNYPLDYKSIIRDYFFLRYAYLHNYKMIIHLHGGLYLFKKDKPWIVSRILKIVFDYDVPMIVLSEKEKEHISDIYQRENVYALPNCIETSDAKRMQRRINNGRLRLLYLGRIEKNKGMDYILRALKALNAQGLDFIFRMAGKESIEGEYINKFKDELGDKFEYCGIVSGKSKNDLLVDSDVFVMPSFYEGLPMAMLECMSFGVVPIVTDVGSICEYVKDGENGKIVKVMDTDSIVNAIVKVDKGRDLLYRLSANAQNTIFTKLKVEDYVENLNGLYEMLL